MSQDLIRPSDQEVYEKVDTAITQLLEQDAYLLQIDSNERSISHRLGLYLQSLFNGWHVDCEYNRNLDGPKRIKDYRNTWGEGITVSNVPDLSVFPDIIVHQRGTHNNLLIIEMKKTTSNVGDDFDNYKLREFKYQFKYRYALFLKVTTGQEEAAVVMKNYLPDVDERQVALRKAWRI